MAAGIVIKNGLMMGDPITKGPQTVTDSVFQGESPYSEQWRKQGGIDAPLRLGGSGEELDYTDKALLIIGTLVGGYLLIKFMQVILRFLKPF